MPLCTEAVEKEARCIALPVCTGHEQLRDVRTRLSFTQLATVIGYNQEALAAGDLVVVSPDVGGVARARAFAKKLSDAPLAIVDKRRSAHNVSEVMNVIGEVRGKVAVLVDDMIDTAGQLPCPGAPGCCMLLLVPSCVGRFASTYTLRHVRGRESSRKELHWHLS